MSKNAPRYSSRRSEPTLFHNSETVITGGLNVVLHSVHGVCPFTVVPLGSSVNHARGALLKNSFRGDGGSTWVTWTCTYRHSSLLDVPLETIVFHHHVALRSVTRHSLHLAEGKMDKSFTWTQITEFLWWLFAAQWGSLTKTVMVRGRWQPLST